MTLDAVLFPNRLAKKFPVWPVAQSQSWLVSCQPICPPIRVRSALACEESLTSVVGMFFARRPAQKEIPPKIAATMQLMTPTMRGILPMLASEIAVSEAPSPKVDMLAIKNPSAIGFRTYPNRPTPRVQKNRSMLDGCRFSDIRQFYNFSGVWVSTESGTRRR